MQFKLPNLLNDCDLTDEFTENMIIHGLRSVDEAYDGFLAITDDGKTLEEACKIALDKMDAV